MCNRFPVHVAVPAADKHRTAFGPVSANTGALPRWRCSSSLEVCAFPVLQPSLDGAAAVQLHATVLCDTPPPAADSDDDGDGDARTPTSSIVGVGVVRVSDIAAFDEGALADFNVPLYYGVDRFGFDSRAGSLRVLGVVCRNPSAVAVSHTRATLFDAAEEAFHLALR